MLLEDIESSIANFTKLKTPQSDMRDQRVLECEASWNFTHTSYAMRSSLAMELETSKTEKKQAQGTKKVTFQLPDGTEMEEP